MEPADVKMEVFSYTFLYEISHDSLAVLQDRPHCKEKMQLVRSHTSLRVDLRRVKINVFPLICQWSSRRTGLLVLVDRFLWVMAEKSSS